MNKKDAYLKLLFYISFMPYILLIIYEIYIMIFGYDMCSVTLNIDCDIIYGIKALRESLPYILYFMFIWGLIPLLLIYDIFYIIYKIKHKKNIERCFWVTDNPLYIKYHDNEWGRIKHNDRYLFEMLILEGFQAGLSWECVLNKRKCFKESFDNFNIDKIINWDESKIIELMNNEGIIRNRRKIEATIINAKVFKTIQEEYKSFDKYIWAFTKGKQIIGNGKLTKSNLSDKISKDLQKRGMKFVGTTIIYSYLQAIGIISDHQKNCYLCKKK